MKYIIVAKQLITPFNVINNGAVVVSGRKILDVGKIKDIKSKYNYKIIDEGDKIITPGLIDSHTHLVFAGDRANEFEMKIKGTSYQDIARKGGGILSTVNATRNASKTCLVNISKKRLDTMLRYGTTTVEIKSGYGLTYEDEIKILEVIQELKKIHPIDIVPTYLAHIIPQEYKNKRKEYIKLVTKKIMPEIARRNLATFCDVFCDEGAFTVKEAEEILTCAKNYGMKLKIHAHEFKRTGAVSLACKLKAVSADHLLLMNSKDINTLSKSNITAVLLPGTSLGISKFAQARRMISSGIRVALATDYNPGTSLCESMQMIISLSCYFLKMTSLEAITASTINAAYSLSLENLVGSIEKGKQADLVIWNVPDYKHIGYHYGVNLVDKVIKAGKILNFSSYE